MFSRMLKLPEDARRAYDLSSLEVAIHAAAPCPVPVKRGDDRLVGTDHRRILQRHGRDGFTLCDSAEWLAHKGTVGKTVFGELHILDDAMLRGSDRTDRKLWFKTASPFEYFNDPVKTAAAARRTAR